MSVAQTESELRVAGEADQELLNEIDFLNLLSDLPKKLLTPDFMDRAYECWENNDLDLLTRLIQRQLHQNLRRVI